jgi:serine/threonine-protein kinase
VTPGEQIAGYRLERLLGRGGMGEVYLATHESLGRKVALKLLPVELGSKEHFRQRFLAESRQAASLDHPHIVPIYEAGEAAGRLFIAMRYVEGSDLGSLIERDGPLDPGRALGLLRGIADALDAAHDRGLVHRDVKPGNILVALAARGGEHAYLADFGLVKQLGSGGDFTQSGQLLGSVGYVAPEQIEGRPIDRRADVYSLACVLFEAVTGRPPFVGERDVATLWAHLQAPRPRPSEIRPELAALDAVIAKGMAVEAAERYATAGELVAAADDVLARPGINSSPGETGLALVDGEGLAGSPGSRRRGVAVAVLLVAALAVAVVAGLGSSGLLAPGSASPGTARGTPATSPGATPSPEPSSSAPVTITASEIEATNERQLPLEPGRYRLPEVRPPVEFDIDGEGWSIDRVFPDAWNLQRRTSADGPVDGYISGGLVQVVLQGPCSDSATQVVGSDPAALVTWLGTNEWLDVSDPVPVNVGGRTGLRVDVSQARSPAGTCDYPPDVPEEVRDRLEETVYVFLFGEDNFWVGPDERIRLMTLDVDGKPFTIVAGVLESATFPSFIEAASPVLMSLQFADS